MAPVRNNGGVEMGGIASEMGQLKVDSAESLGELQEFLRQNRGKTPQEMLGVVANSSLFGSIVMSMILIASGLAVFTLIPYAIREDSAAAQAAAKTAKAAASKQADDKRAESTAGEVEPNGATTDGGKTAGGEPAGDATTGANTNGGPNGERAVEAMGIGEAKAADPKKNPLENDLEDLLDQIK